MKKRIMTGLLACCLSLSLALPGFAAGSIPAQEEVAQVITALGIMAGDAGGDLRLSRTVTRAEFITMAVKASPQGDQVGEASTSPYPDVPYTHWAAGFVEAGVAAGLISGYSDGTFRPASSITLAEGATIALGLLGYSAEDYSGAYPSPQMALYHSLSLDKGLTAQAASAPLTRHDAMYLFYNLLSAKNKEGQPYLTTLGYSLNAAGGPGEWGDERPPGGLRRLAQRHPLPPLRRHGDPGREGVHPRRHPDQRRDLLESDHAGPVGLL